LLMVVITLTTFHEIPVWSLILKNMIPEKD
jgi:hypothetical protein